MIRSKYLYIEQNLAQVNKKSNMTCGDYTMIVRTPEYTDYVLCDGMGSGPRANMSAIMCANRLIHLMQNGVSIYRATEKCVQLMHRARTEDNIPFAAFTVARINKSGHYTILSYEIPKPIIIKNMIAEIVSQKHFTSGHEVVSEAVGKLDDGDSLVLISDGVSQAGLGLLSGMGWGVDGFCKYININIQKGLELEEIIQNALAQTHRLSGRVHMDDTTIGLLTARYANRLNILTGPPADRGLDSAFVDAFIGRTGKKIVSGSTTADMVARELGEQVIVQEISTSFSQPPRYSIEGIDIVSEGAVTLNQVYNILDMDRAMMVEASVVCEIALQLLEADVINIYLGDVINTAHNDISFRQIGIVERRDILRLIAQKLQNMGKVVQILSPSDINTKS